MHFEAFEQTLRLRLVSGPGGGKSHGTKWLSRTVSIETLSVEILVLSKLDAGS
jgi:hypothetical protein